MTNLQGAILAAGRGERLRRSGAEGLPKALVELEGEPLLVRQARAMLAAGASGIWAVINSETAALAESRRIKFPPELRLIVRDTPHSMESLFVLGEMLSPGRFLLATVDAVVPPAEFARFTGEATAMTEPGAPDAFDGALGVARWRGDRRPLFAQVTETRLIAELGDPETTLVTAGIYLLPTRVFSFASEARQLGLDAMRRFLAMLLTKGIRLGAIEIASAIDIDEPTDLQAARGAVRGIPR